MSDKSPDTKVKLNRRQAVLRQELGQLWTRTADPHSTQLHGAQRIGFCSTNPGEGSSSMAANYACFLGEHGQRVMLIDANFRDPGLAKSFNLPNNQGLWDLLEGVATLDEVVAPQVAPGVNFMPAGDAPNNFLVPKSGFNLEAVFAQVLKNNDLLILDLPPLAASPEVNLLLPQLDGVALVVQANRNKACVVQRSARTIQSTGCKILGTVLNRVTYDLPSRVDRML